MNVYVPTTPNPTSGYTLMVPKNKVIELDISVDEVLKVCYFNGCSSKSDNKLKQSK